MGLFRKRDERKILETTDGYFNGKPRIKKPRKVVVVHQRTDDKAIAVVKLHEKKEGRSNNMQKPILTPEKHKSLDKETTVEKRIIWGKGPANTKTPMKARDMIDCRDKVTRRELKEIKKGIDDTEKNKEHHKTVLKKWNNHFKNNDEK